MSEKGLEIYDSIRKIVNGDFQLENKDKPFNLDKDINKFYEKGFDEPGKRARLLLSELIRKAKDLRDDIQENRKK